VSGKWLMVYAGGPRPDPASGAFLPPVRGGVTLITIPLDPNPPNQNMSFHGDVLAPPGIGDLTVTAFSGTTLTLVDAAGHQVHFNVVTRRFIDG
jgi:hypothetical protein